METKYMEYQNKNYPFINTDNLEEILNTLKEVEQDHGVPNITYAAKRFCENNGHPYNDGVRRATSYMIEKYGTPQADTPMVSTDLPSTTAKVLFFDLETSFMLLPAFKIYNNNYTAPMSIIQDWKLYTFSCKWMGTNEVQQFRLTEEEFLAGDDKRLVKELYQLLEDCDIAIAHNANKFDVKKANAKFFEHGLGLPSPYQVVDTLALAKKSMSPSSMSLDYLAKLSGSEAKMETSQGLWLRAIKGDYEAIIEMATYCDQDIVVLEQVFYALRPYLRGLPNMGLFSIDGEVCATCGSNDFLDTKSTPYRTSVNEFATMRCACCGSTVKSRIASKRTKPETTAIYR